MLNEDEKEKDFEQINKEFKVRRTKHTLPFRSI